MEQWDIYNIMATHWLYVMGSAGQNWYLETDMILQSNLKPIFAIYLFCGVLWFRGTYGIILTLFGTYSYGTKSTK